MPLELHPEAERLVRDAYVRFAAAGLVPFAELNEARRKMARLPQGAEPVPNPVGGAPGVVLRREGTTFVSLPGVPEELEAIVEESLGGVFAGIFRVAHYEERTLVVDLQDESAIADILGAVEQAHPEVYVKSRAKKMGPAVTLRITLSARGDDAAAVERCCARRPTSCSPGSRRRGTGCGPKRIEGPAGPALARWPVARITAGRRCWRCGTGRCGRAAGCGGATSRRRTGDAGGPPAADRSRHAGGGGGSSRVSMHITMAASARRKGHASRIGGQIRWRTPWRGGEPLTRPPTGPDVKVLAGCLVRAGNPARAMR